MSIVSLVQNPTTWLLYFAVIAAFVIISLLRTKFTRETWKNFFQFMLGVGVFLIGLGWGFQWIPSIIGLDAANALEYSVSSVITLAFWALYIFLLYRLFNKLQEKEGWQWLGIVAITFIIGCIMNAIATGGRYLPVVGWFM